MALASIAAAGLGSNTAGLIGTGIGLLGALKGPEDRMQQSSSTSTSTPFQQEQYKQLLDRAEALYGQQYGPEFTQALANERANLQAGRGLSQQAVGMLQSMLGDDSALTKTAEGAYLDPNSEQYQNMYELATRNMRENFSDTIMPAINNQAYNAGRWGSAASQRARNKAGQLLGQQLSDVNVQMAEQERQRQLNAINQRAALAGNLASYQGATANRLGAIDPYALQKSRLGDYQGFISGGMGSTSASTSTAPVRQSNAMTRLGAGILNANKWASGLNDPTDKVPDNPNDLFEPF